MTILRTLQVLTPHPPIELRVVTPNGAMLVERFDTAEAAAHYADRFSDARAAYVVMNPFDATTIKNGNGATDACVTRRRRLLIDVDPVRPTDTNATDSELEQAQGAAKKIAAYLSTRGWPAPIEALSGNGAHLLYAIDLPNTPESRDLVRAVSKALSEMFDTATVKIDQTVYNAARITKLYGTMTRKGPHSADRPHRQSALTVVTDPLVGVTEPQLRDVAGTKRNKKTSTPGAAEAYYDVDQILDQLTVLREYVKDDIRYCEIRCPWVAEHSTQPPDDKPTGTVFSVLPSGALVFKCQHDHCENRHWSDLRDHLGIRPTTKTKGRSHVTKLINLVQASGAELFRSPTGDYYATLAIGSHRETMALTDRTMREWLASEYFRATGTGVSSGAIADAQLALCGMARTAGLVRAVYVRVASFDDRVFLDLGREDRRTLRITAAGWDVTDTPSDVCFLRPPGMLPLPDPQRSETSIADLLAKVINVKADRPDMLLLVGWLVAALRGRKPYPILAVSGEYGAAKTYMCRLARQIIDPNEADLSSIPKEARDLMIAALNSHIIGFDNLSFIPDWLSDKLCCLSTGAGFRTRALFTDKGETIFSAARPVVINGIADVIRRGDLMDRTLPITLDAVLDTSRKTETDVNTAFEKARPAILAALASGVARALKSPVILTSQPRMADFAATVESAAPAFNWKTNDFLTAYAERRESAIDVLLDSDPIAAALESLHQLRAKQTTVFNPVPEWIGTTAELRAAIAGLTQEIDQKALPKSDRGLTGALRRLAPGLRRQRTTIDGPTQVRDGTGARKTPDHHPMGRQRCDVRRERSGRRG